MTHLKHSPAPWHFHKGAIRSDRGDIIVFADNTADGKLALAAPDMLALLRQIYDAKKERETAVVLSNAEEVARLSALLTRLIDVDALAFITKLEF